MSTLIIVVGFLGIICAAILRFNPKLEILKYGVTLVLIFFFAKAVTNFNKLRTASAEDFSNQQMIDIMIENQLSLAFIVIFVLSLYTEIYRSKKSA